ncbi:MAG: hypothetical protein JKX84_00200 [Flavobacteriales bacterium]|nr:hypothetical protein [Flavobacteriales bacterium]
MKQIFLIVLLAAMLPRVGLAQDAAMAEADTIVEIEKTDSIKVKKPHSPLKASIMSAVLPGPGQIYNGKWWKVPIVYGAIGGLVYSSVFNNIKCATYRNAYLIRIDDDPNTVDQFVGEFTDSNLRDLKDKFQRQRDLSLVLTGVFYLLNIVDASVDGHLKNFDVSDDLTLNIEPSIQQVGTNVVPTIGITLVLR